MPPPPRFAWSPSPVPLTLHGGGYGRRRRAILPCAAQRSGGGGPPEGRWRGRRREAAWGVTSAGCVRRTQATAAMDGFVLLGIIGVVFFFLGPIGFFVALRQGRRLGTLERQVARLRADLMNAAAATVPPEDLEEQADVVGPAAGPTASADLEAGLAAGTETEPVAPPPLTDAAASATFPPQPAAQAPISPPPPQPEEEAPSTPPPSPPARPRPGLEEALGTRWTVWVGGAALALGAVLLVRYSIEQGYFGPGTRVILGLVVSASARRRWGIPATARGADAPQHHRQRQWRLYPRRADGGRRHRRLRRDLRRTRALRLH